MRTVLRYYKKYIPFVCIIFLVLFGQVISELLLPTYMSDIINNGIVAGDLEHIKHVGMIMIVIAFAAVVFSVTGSFFASMTAAKAARSIRKSLFTKVTAFSRAEIETFSTASLITRSTNDVQMIQQATVMCLRMMMFAPIMGIGAVFMALRTSVALSWTVGLALICVCGLMVFSFVAIFPRFRLMQEKLDRVNLIMKERLSGTLVVRAFRTELHEQKRFDDANMDLTKLYIFVNKCLAFMMPTMTLIMSGVGILIIWAGAHLVEAQHLMIGDVLAYLQYAMHVIMSFMFVTMIFVMIPRAAVSAKRVGQVIDTKVSITDPENPVEVPALATTATQTDAGALTDDAMPQTETGTVLKTTSAGGTVEFRDVAFAYPDAEEMALQGITFTAEAGKTTAIIGGTGCGKSTLINLIPRFYDATEGQVLVDGIDVRDMRQTDLHRLIGLVPQRGTLFSGTIESNLLYGDADATTEELARAAEIAQALAFINDKPDGFQTEVAQGGTNVSGGQKQRLCIARALVKNPEILVFDDSFSALDFATDKALRKALRKQADRSTFIIVAQRINTIMDADQIIVLEDGQIAGKGTHQQLMETCPVYSEIAYSQLSKEELERGRS